MITILISYFVINLIIAFKMFDSMKTAPIGERTYMFFHALIMGAPILMYVKIIKYKED